jgi:uncharacterized cupredoxin-like copper-binding protein
MKTSRSALYAVALAAGAVILAGCGSSSSSSSSTPTSAASSAAATSAPAAASSAPGGSSATTVTATETDFHIALSASTFKPGSYTFKATNGGKFPHALEIDGPGVEDKASSQISPGQSTTLAVTLAAGTYEIYCPVANHKAMGMDLHITVA